MNTRLAHHSAVGEGELSTKVQSQIQQVLTTTLECTEEEQHQDDTDEPHGTSAVLLPPEENNLGGKVEFESYYALSLLPASRRGMEAVTM